MDWNFEKVKILVENVQKYPFLYDGNFLCNIMGETHETWDKIAEAVGNGATGFLCKRRWQRLRNACRNSIKLGYRVRPVGIERHLEFLMPFIRSKEEVLAKTSKENSLSFCKQLAQIMQEYPQLHFDNQSSDDWQKIATRMGTGDTPEECRSYWSTLKNRYSHHLKGGCQMRPRGIEQHLTFLNTSLAARDEANLESTIKMINLVRENPILYVNPNSNSNEQQAAWKSLAKKMNNGVTAPECEANWRGIRNAYANCLQKGFAMQQVGITEHLDFLVPYLKLPEVEPKRETKRIRLDEKVARVQQQRRIAAKAAVLRHKHLKVDAEDEDTLFLFEFLLDVAKMNDGEKMVFKLNAMSLAEKYRYS